MDASSLQKHIGINCKCLIGRTAKTIIILIPSYIGAFSKWGQRSRVGVGGVTAGDIPELVCAFDFTFNRFRSEVRSQSPQLQFLCCGYRGCGWKIPLKVLYIIICYYRHCCEQHQPKLYIVHTESANRYLQSRQYSLLACRSDKYY